MSDGMWASDTRSLCTRPRLSLPARSLAEILERCSPSVSNDRCAVLQPAPAALLRQLLEEVCLAAGLHRGVAQPEVQPDSARGQCQLAALQLHEFGVHALKQ